MERIIWRRWYLTHEWRKARERLVTTLVWSLPRWLIYWATIRLAAHATTGVYRRTDPNTLSVMEALKRWENPTTRPPIQLRRRPGGIRRHSLP
jgi:hypothetical protein